MNVWLVEVEDLSHLGGPMGTEYTTTQDIVICEDRECAIAWARRNYGKPLPKPSVNTSREVVFDCGHIGYRIKQQKLETVSHG